MIRRHPLHIAVGVQLRQLRRAELLVGHHPPETADGLVVQGVVEDLPHLVQQRVLRDLREHGDVPGRVLHMDVDAPGVRLVLRRRGVHDALEDRLLAGEMVVQRRGLDAHGSADLAHADGVIAPAGKQLQRLVQDPPLRILLLHGSSKI